MEKPQKSYRNRIILLIAFAAVLVVLYKLEIFSYFSTDFVQRNIEVIKSFIEQNYCTSACFYIGSLSLVIACSIPLGILLPIFGGFLFGWLPGVLFSIAAATIGGMIAFLISRYLIGDYFQKRFGERLEKFNNELDQYGYLYLLGLHFFPITPFFVLNILSGLTRIPLFTFLWTTIVGVAPAFAIYSYLGNQLTDLTHIKAALSLKIGIAFVALKVLSLCTLFIGRFGKKIVKKS